MCFLCILWDDVKNYLAFFSAVFSAVCRGGWFETAAYLDRTFCIDMYMNVTPCCALAAGSNYQFDTGEVLRPREREDQVLVQVPTLQHISSSRSGQVTIAHFVIRNSNIPRR